MRTPRTSETAFNQELANQLRRRHPRWRELVSDSDAIAAEQTRVLGRARRRRPDIVVRHPGGLPVIVETEFSPARSVEDDARSRLGELVGTNLVEGVLAVRIPVDLARHQTSLETAIGRARFDWCLFAAAGTLVDRWPREGWLSGSIDQLAEAIEFAALSETRLNAAADALEEGILGGAENLEGHRSLRTDPFVQISELLHQEDGTQTVRMAVAIIANALVFQSAIAGNLGIPGPDAMRDKNGMVNKTTVLQCWREILKINYWPIFRIAADLLWIIPIQIAWRFLDHMVRLAESLSAMGTASMHDLSGQMFQRLIADRKFLATFYTLPPSSSLLANLAIERLEIDWGNPDAIAGLRIADFACGTGSLLAAAQHAVAVRHRRAGGDDRALHARMLEDVLIAADIMPAATHLTASTISGAHPRATFGRTRVHTVPYGVENGEVRIGSLDLILEDQVMSLFGTGATRRVGGQGESVEQSEVVPGESCDIVIMNPPFTRPTNHEVAGVPVPSFAGFGTAEVEQELMSARLDSIRQALLSRRNASMRRPGRPLSHPAGHGNAGLASNFLDLAHAKLRPGGCLALVLPAAFAKGAAWERARQLLDEQYRDVSLIGIAATGSTERAFSADTGMAEVLVLATRRQGGAEDDAGTTFVANLNRRPRSRLEGALVARAVEASRTGEVEAGRIEVGENLAVGNHQRLLLVMAGNAVGLRHPQLALAMSELSSREVRLQAAGAYCRIPVAPLHALGRRGAVDRDISGRAPQPDMPPRGPFEIEEIEPGEYPDYPALWSHDAARETRLVVEPDRRGSARPGCVNRAQELWNQSVSRLHFNRDFQLNSQPLAACLTQRRSLGGRAWPNFRPKEISWEIPILLWANTTLGLMSFWWHGTRQQQGRSTVTISRLPGLLTLDARQLDARQIEQCDRIFEAFSRRQFLPANEAYRDEARHELDSEMLCRALGLNAAVLERVETMREQWCREPSVHGGKGTRPEGA